MLKKLQKYFSAAQAEPAAEAAQHEEVNMSDPTEQAKAPAENTAELQAQMESATAALTALQAQFAELSEKYATAQATLDAQAAEKAALVAEAAEKEMAARKEAIVKAVGTENAEAVLAVTKDMPREQFNTIVSAMAASVDAEAKSPMFTEQGAAAEAPVDEKPQMTHFNQYIKK